MTVNDLASAVIEVSGKEGVRLRHVDGPQGVRGRNSDNRRLREVLGWEPSVSIREGLVPTYGWIAARVRSCASRAVSRSSGNGSTTRPRASASEGNRAQVQRPRKQPTPSAPSGGAQ